MMHLLLYILLSLLPVMNDGQSADVQYRYSQEQSTTIPDGDRQTLQDHSDRYRSVAVLSDASTLYRICNTRPQRLSSQHGSKYERSAGRSAFIQQRNVKPHQTLYDGRSRRESAPFHCAASCLYYVYALRHIIR